jgi:hypothetical protein
VRGLEQLHDAKAGTSDAQNCSRLPRNKKAADKGNTTYAVDLLDAAQIQDQFLRPLV